MKKTNIQIILLVGFSLIAFIVFISGVRELIVLNRLNEFNNSAKNMYKDHSYLNDNIILINNNNILLDRIISTQNIEEFELLKNEYNKNIRAIYQYSNKVFSEEESFIKTEELKRLFNNNMYLYKNDYLKDYSLIIEKKGNLLDFERYYIESLNINYNLTKDQIKEELEEELIELNNLTGILYNKINNNLGLILQRTNQLMNKSEGSISQKFKNAKSLALVFLVSVIIICLVVMTAMSRSIIGPLKVIQKQLDLITQGELPTDISINSGKEIRRMAYSINKLINGLRRGAEFSQEIGKGNFESSYTPLSDNDVLGNSLLTLRDNLQIAQTEEEKRKTEDAQRNRTNVGLTMFSEILRQQTGNIKDLADDIISSLVKFMKANQGALFFLNEEDKDNIHYELLGAYAYNRKKYLSKQIKPGEGLVGAVALEKYTVYMTDIPNEYVEIESGVGSANPRSILIVPLKIEQNVLGVIELASFNELEAYEIEMVEKIAESIAASLANARINMQTAALLERSIDQEKLVLEQEKELTQSLAEIKELTKKVEELIKENEQLKKM